MLFKPALLSYGVIAVPKRATLASRPSGVGLVAASDHRRHRPICRSSDWEPRFLSEQAAHREAERRSM